MTTSRCTHRYFHFIKRNLGFWHLPRVNTSHKVRQGDLSAGDQALEVTAPQVVEEPPHHPGRLEEK